jgi:hypothetical protein
MSLLSLQGALSGHRRRQRETGTFDASATRTLSVVCAGEWLPDATLALIDVKRRLSKGKLQKFQPALKKKSGLPQTQINAP